MGLTIRLVTKVRRQLGRNGEDRACERLVSEGMSIVARNVRTRYGEIDVIAMDGMTLVFVEVKTLRSGRTRGPATPIQAVGRRKQLQVRQLARAWLGENSPPRCSEIRFDVVGVTVNPDGSAVIEHVKAAF